MCISNNKYNKRLNPKVHYLLSCNIYDRYIDNFS